MKINDEKESNKGEVKGRTLRLSESTFGEFQKLSETSGTVEETLSDLISTYKRTSLETDDEFGSQIKQVNDLTTRMGEIFESIIKQSNTKTEIQENEKRKSDENYRGQLFESHSKINELKEELQAKDSGVKAITDELHVLQVNYDKKDDQILNLEKQIGDSDERIDELKDSNKEKDEKIAEKNEKIDELQKEIESRGLLVTKNKELNDSVASLSKENETLKEKHSNSIKALDSAHENKLKELAFEHEKLLFEKEKELQKLFQDRIDKIQDDMNSKYEERLSNVLDKHNQQLIDLSGTIKQLEIENADLKLSVAVTSSLPEDKKEDKTK